MSKVFITGGAGFIGHNVAQELADLGHKVLIYDSFSSYFPETEQIYRKNLQDRLRILRDKIKIVRGDTKNSEFLIKSMKEFQPDIVIHLANIPVANASNRFSSEALKVNLIGTMNIIEAVRSVPSVKRLVYASSSYTYGHFQYEPADEKHPLSPIDTYGGTKVASEAIIQGMGRRFNIEYVIVRPSAVYGPTGSNGAVSQLFVERPLKGKSIFLNNGGQTRLDFTYVKDTAHGIVLATLSPKAKNEIFNITKGEARSLGEFVKIVKKYIPEMVIEERNFEEYIPKRGALDISKAKKLLGYKPKYSLEDGIAEYIEYTKNHLY